MVQLSDVQIASAVKQYWPGITANDVPVAVAIALAESSGNTEAINKSNRNGTKDWGLFQINDVNWNGESASQRVDVQTNIRKAAEVKIRQGWGAWSVVDSGRYRSFLERGTKAAQGAPSSGSSGTHSSGSASGSSGSDGTVGDAIAGGIAVLSPATWVSQAVSGGVNSITGTISRIANSWLMFLIAAVLIGIGIYILVQRRAVSAAGKIASVAMEVAPQGKIAKVAGKAAKVAKAAS